MNALLPRDQSTLPKACLGSLLGPMFARLVLLLALSPVGKLEATRWKHPTTGSFQSCVPRPTFPTSSNVTVPASETSFRTCSVSSSNMTESSQKADCIYLYTATSGETASVQTCELLLALTYGHTGCSFLNLCCFFWSIKSTIRSKWILGVTSAHASTASSSVS